MKRSLLFSINLAPGLWLGLWGCPDYVPRTATSPRARGRIEVRVMGTKGGGLFQRSVWPRRVMLAENALALSDDLKGEVFVDSNMDAAAEFIRAHAERWFGGARS